MIYEGVKWRRVLQAGNGSYNPSACCVCKLDEEKIQIDMLPLRVCQVTYSLLTMMRMTRDQGWMFNLSINIRMSDLQDDGPQGAAAAERESSTIIQSVCSKCHRFWWHWWENRQQCVTFWLWPERGMNNHCTSTCRQILHRRQDGIRIPLLAFQDMQLVIRVPLLAECSWNTDNSVSAPDQDSPPENYNHTFEDDLFGSNRWSLGWLTQIRQGWFSKKIVSWIFHFYLQVAHIEW